MILVETKFLVKSGEKLYSFTFHHSTNLLMLNWQKQVACFWEVTGHITESTLENALKDARKKVPAMFG